MSVKRLARVNLFQVQLSTQRRLPGSLYRWCSTHRCRDSISRGKYSRTSHDVVEYCYQAPLNRFQLQNRFAVIAVDGVPVELVASWQNRGISRPRNQNLTRMMSLLQHRPEFSVSTRKFRTAHLIAWKDLRECNS